MAAAGLRSAHSRNIITRDSLRIVAKSTVRGWVITGSAGNHSRFRIGIRPDRRSPMCQCDDANPGMQTHESDAKHDATPSVIDFHHGLSATRGFLMKSVEAGSSRIVSSPGASGAIATRSDCWPTAEV